MVYPNFYHYQRYLKLIIYNRKIITTLISALFFSSLFSQKIYEPFKNEKVSKQYHIQLALDRPKIDGNLDNTEVNGEGFLGLDNNDNFIGSFVIRYKEISEIFKRLENHNIISSDINNALTIIADTSEALAELNNELPKISIRIQQGYIYIFGIKILKGPRLEDIKNF